MTISCEEKGFDGTTATFLFTCADTGRGMSAAFQQHAFEAFAQEESGARTAYKGTGLGLPIAKELVEQMGGKSTLRANWASAQRSTSPCRSA